MELKAYVVPEVQVFELSDLSVTLCCSCCNSRDNPW